MRMYKLLASVLFVLFWTIKGHTVVDFDTFFESMSQLENMNPVNRSTMCHSPNARLDSLEFKLKETYLEMKRKILETTQSARPHEWLRFISMFCTYANQKLKEGSNKCLKPYENNETHVLGIPRPELVEKISFVSDFIESSLSLLEDVFTAVFENMVEEVRNYEGTEVDNCIKIVEKEIERELVDNVAGKMEIVKDLDRTKKDVMMSMEGDIQMSLIKLVFLGGTYFSVANCGFPSEIHAPEYRNRFISVCTSNDGSKLTENDIPILLNTDKAKYKKHPFRR